MGGEMFYGMNAWFLASLALGALWWISIVSLPVWGRLEGRAAAPAFTGAMRRGGPIIAVMLLASAGLGLAAASDDADLKWAVGAAFLLLAAGFGAVLALGPAAQLNALSDPSEAQDDAEAHERAVRNHLKIWARWHLARCMVASTGVFFFIWAAH